MAKRNAQAAALSLRAGNAGCAVAVDTRAKIVKAKKGRGSYDRRSFNRGEH
ncbi:hypothetical protein [Microvirga massiliensis]|jgi:stalled ribosome alternative rescue factor ArfA|uniref:hypothetical protein n=1 Tax=Microvirga massiliensis TaxID=1033741 RepID=UPI000AD2537F|nr:hypothetical protein [Microvirga massiliensis]